MSSTTAPAPPPHRPGLRAAWGALDHRQRRVVAAVALVLVTLALPWYSEESVTQRGPGSIVRTGSSLSGLAGMSFIEAGLLVVLAGVLALMWGRGAGRRFVLPYPDGTLVCAAGTWMGLLIVYRLFARPHGESSAQEHTLIGLNWGIFVSLLAVGVLFAAGFDLRRHGPRNPVPGEPGPVPPERYPDVDPATIVVGPRPDEQPTAVVPSSSPSPPPPTSPPGEQPTTVVPAPRPDDEPTHEWPSRMPRPPRTPRPQPPDERR
ncbi:MAG: hypothetical protein ITG02_16705 [Patulibacter sp.]|nr:hypothetical protein [Patulibacter sp.]